MSMSGSAILELFSKRKALLSVVVAATLIATSAAAVTVLSSPAAKTILTILSMSSYPEEAYVEEAVEWIVVVEIQDHGQQGKGLLFTWDWDDGSYTVYDLKSLGTNSTATDVETHAWSEPGTYEVVVSIWDGYGPEQNAFHNVSATMPFTVKPEEVNTPPVADFTVYPGEGTTETVFAFNANSSWDMEDPVESLKVRWDWQNDGVWDTNLSEELAIAHQFSAPAVYSVVLEVMDTGGLTDITSLDVTVLEPVVLTPHDPIHIEGNIELVAMAASESWPGSGTEEDPYAIELFEIAGGGLESAIWIQDTTLHFVVRECHILDVDGSAIHLLNVVNASVQDNAFTSCPFYSIYCEESHGLSATGNTIDGGTHCIGVIDCQDIFIGDNLVQDSGWWPLWLAYSTDVTLRGNSFHGSGIEIEGWPVSHWNTHDIDDSNTVNGQPVYYFKDQTGGSAPSHAGQIILANCTGMSIQSIVTGRISIGFGSDNTITESLVSSVHYGITLSFSSSNTICSTDVVDCFYGIRTEHADDTMITDSVVAGGEYAMWLQQSDRLMITNNSVLYSGWYGILLYYSSFAEVRGNHIAGSSNTGMFLLCADSNLIASNNFVDNYVQASEYSISVQNIWDDGYPTGGNYWSDYSGTDEYSGPEQDIPGSDGIGDTPYVLSSVSQDRYPLMEPVTAPQNTAPTASFVVEPPVGPAGMVFTFDASSSLDAQDPVESLQVRWDWECDGVWDTEYTVDKEAEHVYDVPGTYTVMLEVIDGGGLSDFALRNVTALESPELTPHAPISITSDEEFTAENGVVGGSGVPDDPYVISGWDIESGDSACINISDTRAYFVICGVELRIKNEPYTHDFHTMHLVNVYNGYIIDSRFSDGLDGLRIEASGSIRVIDCDFIGCNYGVEASISSDFGLRGCSFEDCFEAFTAWGSCGFYVDSCRLMAGYAPCTLDDCAYGTFTDNYLEPLSRFREGAYVMGSSNMAFKGNRFINCSIDITGWRQTHFDTHSISPDNTVNGKPILHYQGVNGLVVDGVEAGEVIITDCENVIVSNMAFSSGFAGVIVAFSNHVTIENNAFTSCYIGVRVKGCSDVALRGNVAHEVVFQGIGIWSTTGATVEGNDLSCNGLVLYQTLMPVFHSSNLSITNNTFTDGFEGMYIFSTSDFQISGNEVSNMTRVGVHVGYSSLMDIAENEFAENGIGLNIENCAGAKVYHNNFLNNDVQASEVDSSDCHWDDGYPSGGNYWDDYHGVDRDKDGIGDTPYEISEGIQDNYPLMDEYSIG